MKRIIVLFAFLLTVCGRSFSQYIGVKAKYIDTRLVPKPDFPDTREDRLVLSFYNVDPMGIWTPTSLSNYDIYVKAGGLQVAGLYAIDSSGANYPGYNFTAPVVASFYNSLGREYFDCGTYGSVHLVANGHELDCGFLVVSEWLYDNDWNQYEQFNTIEVGLPYYFYPDPLAFSPGNVNFGPATTAGGYNYYMFSCGGSLQSVTRGTMMGDSSTNIVPLPIRFANISAATDETCRVRFNWSNLTESGINYYLIERSINEGPFEPVDSIPPTGNTGGRSDYSYMDTALVHGFNLYRVKAVENTGNNFYSMVMKVNGCTEGLAFVSQPRLVIYPNPSQNGRFALSASNLPKGRYDVVIVASSGRQTRITTIDHTGGTLNKLFEARWVTPGIYTILLRSTELNLIQKIIITN